LLLRVTDLEFGALTLADPGETLSEVCMITAIQEARNMRYDTVIINGRWWFDGTGAPSAVRNIGVCDGRVATIADGPLDTTGADVIDATGQWVIPGMIDIHTHYGIETRCEPALSE
jgi:N-acyl-D-aspartate/D-glutamate deacylase